MRKRSIMWAGLVGLLAVIVVGTSVAATGKLAHAIAHEINNPLEAVTNLIYLARTAAVRARALARRAPPAGGGRGRQLDAVGRLGAGAVGVAGQRARRPRDRGLG